MKAISRAIDRFCLKRRRFGIRRLTMLIVAASVVVYIIGLMDTTGAFFGYILFDPERILKGEIWRLVSWTFFPFALNDASFYSIVTTALTLYFFYWIGSSLEYAWGQAKFTIYYFSGVLLSLVYAFLMWYVLGDMRALVPFLFSPMYLNLSLFLAFAVLFPDERILLFMIIPIRAKWLALLTCGVYLVYAVRYLLGGLIFPALLPIPAIINFLLICGGALQTYLAHAYPRRAKYAGQAVNFKKAARDARRAADAAPYRHKCAVCGRTDAEYPELEFRYCSRCNGYHCYCGDHINSHTHL
ncbi:MAG: hypothetical protein LBT12_00535 [Oscillospiraceae bacterium]|nr:hypothetical protein [Oscillospiraceae bacterium]